MNHDLERSLRELAPMIDFPPTPDLAGAIERRLAHGTERRPWRTLLLAAAILLVVAAAAGATAASIWLDVPSVSVRRIATAPAIPPGAALALGDPMAPAQAAAQVGFVVPRVTDPGLGPAGSTYVAFAPHRRLSLVWPATTALPALPPSDVGAILTVFRGNAPSDQVVAKMLGPDTDLEPVAVGDGAAWWISGAPHFVVFETPDGSIDGEELRLAANVLLWQQDGLVLRLESRLSREQALAIARSVVIDAEGG